MTRADSHVSKIKRRLRPNRRAGARSLGCILAWLLAVCVLSVEGGSAASSLKTDLSSAIIQADSLYKDREDPGNVRKAIAILRHEVAEHPRSYEAWWRIAEYDCYLARHVPDKQQDSILEDGIAAGKKAESLEPGRPEGHFWVGANEGLLAENRGIFGGLHLIGSIRDEMQEVMKLDPDYMEYGAERILGRLYYEAPFFDGGNKQLSVRLLEDCLKRYPGDSLTMIYLADSYRATGHRRDARKMLEKILSLSSDPANGPELADYKSQARQDLKKYFHVHS